MRGYGMGKNMARILNNYWWIQRIVHKLGKYLGAVLGKGIRIT